MPATTSIEIDWPTDLPLTGCTAVGIVGNFDVIAANTCNPTTSRIVFDAPFTTTKPIDYEMTVVVTDCINPDSVRLVGQLTISILQDGQLKDQFQADTGYLPSAGSISKTNSDDGGVTSSSYFTYVDGVTYTFHMKPDHAVEASGFIKIELPADIGTSGSGTNYRCLLGTDNTDECKVDDDARTVTLELASD